MEYQLSLCYDIWVRIWKVNTVDSEGGVHEITGRE